jgi:hypothetical protein
MNDMNETYKIISGKYDRDIDVTPNLDLTINKQGGIQTTSY